MRKPASKAAGASAPAAAPVAPAAPAASANALRGEAELVLDGAAFRLRPSFEAIVEIEAQTGRSIAELALTASRGATPLASLGIIAAELIKAGGRAANDPATAHVGARRIGELIQEAGVLDASIRLAKVLSDAATGGYTALGEARAMTGQ